jgi:hypothetical protein
VEQEGPYFVCETCGERVDAADPDVVRAFEQKVIRTFGAGTQRIDGMPVLFHRGCFSSGGSYRLEQDLNSRTA